MGVINFSIPESLVLNLVKNNNVKNFIETGTYKGNSSFWAAKHFDNVFTIELNKELYEETSSRKDAPKNITFLQGNSKVVLPELVNTLDGQSIFWLDGHWCMGAGGKEDECPLMNELMAISKTKDSIILIDDARCFLGPLPPPHNANDWPRIDEIFSLIRNYFPDYTSTIVEDVIVAVPASVKQNLDDYWQNNYNRIYSLKNAIGKYSKISVLKQVLKG
jgi:hypothetical protein